MFCAHYWATLGPYVIQFLDSTPIMDDLYMYSFHLSFGVFSLLFSRQLWWHSIPIALWSVVLVSVIYLSLLPLNWLELTVLRSISGLVSAILFSQCFLMIKALSLDGIIPLMYSIGTLILESSVMLSAVAITNNTILVLTFIPFVVSLPLIFASSRMSGNNVRSLSYSGALDIPSLLWPLFVLNVICHCAFFYLLLKLSHVFVGESSTLYIGTAVFFMAPMFSLGAMISGISFFRPLFFIIGSLFVSIIGIAYLYMATTTNQPYLGVIGTALFALGNGFTISRLVYSLSILSTTNQSYPVRSMAIVMLFTFVLGMFSQVITIDPIILIGNLYLVGAISIGLMLIISNYNLERQ